MTKLIEKLTEFSNAGDKATQGEWVTDYTRNIWGGDHSDGDPELLLKPHSAERDDAQFITLSANMRPVIKEAIAEIEGLSDANKTYREVCTRVRAENKQLREALEALVNVKAGEDLQPYHDVAKQALKGETK
jgi:hypothetical protein